MSRRVLAGGLPPILWVGAWINGIIHGPGLAQPQIGHGARYIQKWLLLGVLIGIVAGLGALAFTWAIQWATTTVLGNVAGFQPPQPLGEGGPVAIGPSHHWLIPVVTTIGGLLAGVIVFGLAPEAEGHGTDAAIAAFHHRKGLIRWRVPYVKLFASAITIGTGGSAGREGPTAQIGAGFGSFLAQVLRLSVEDRRIAVAAGLGAGIGAIFKAPLGGGILAAEILYLQGMEVEVLVPAFISTLVAFSIFTGVKGFTPVFGSGLTADFHDPWSLLLYALLGIICGLAGVLYVKTFYGVESLFRRWRVPRWTKPAIGGLLVGLIALALPQVLGMGYGWVQQAMDPSGPRLGLTLVILLVFAKIAATALSVGSGGSGGVFAPGIVIGGFCGTASWILFHGHSGHVPPTAAPFAVVGMMAFFGAVGHAPLAVMVMVAEMTGSYVLLAPAMLAVGLATVVVGRHTIYRSQVLSPAHSPAHRGQFTQPLLHHLRVGEAMRRDVITIDPDSTVEKAARIMHERQIKGLPVVDHRGALVGIVANIDVVQVAKDRWPTVLAREIMSKDLALAQEQDRLDDALQRMRERSIGRLPVVADGDPTRLVGLVTTSDIVECYGRAHDGQGRL